MLNRAGCDECSGADLCRILVEAEHLAMEEIMTDFGDSNLQPPVSVVCQRHLETVLQRVTPSVKVQLFIINCFEFTSLLKRRCRCWSEGRKSIVVLQHLL